MKEIEYWDSMLRILRKVTANRNKSIFKLIYQVMNLINQKAPIISTSKHFPIQSTQKMK